MYRKALDAPDDFERLEVAMIARKTGRGTEAATRLKCI